MQNWGASDRALFFHHGGTGSQREDGNQGHGFGRALFWVRDLTVG